MDYAIVWDDDSPEDVRVETSGPVDVDELNGMVEEMLADNRFRSNLRILVDHSRASWAGVGADEVRRRADLVHAQADRIGPQRIAFVIGGRVDLGVMRLLEAYTMVGVPFEAKTFPTVAAARDWL